MRATQRKVVAWQWGQLREGKGEAAGVGDVFGWKRKGDFCRAALAKVTKRWRRLLAKSP